MSLVIEESYLILFSIEGKKKSGKKENSADGPQYGPDDNQNQIKKKVSQPLLGSPPVL